MFNDDDTITEEFAVRIFEQAILERRASELLEALWAGCGCTIDLKTGKLLIAKLI